MPLTGCGGKITRILLCGVHIVQRVLFDALDLIITQLARNFARTPHYHAAGRDLGVHRYERIGTNDTFIADLGVI